MTQLDRIEEKLTKLLTIAEVLLKEGIQSGRISPEVAALSTGIQELGTPIVDETAGLAENPFVTLNEDQELLPLFRQYPRFQEDFYTLDSELSALKGPMGAAMLKEATLGMIAKSLRMDGDEFLQKVQAVLSQYA